MYDLAGDPLEMRNLAHPAHATAATERERARLHQRLLEVMLANGTLPDEICWPAFEDHQPLAAAETLPRSNQRGKSRLKRMLQTAVWALFVLVAQPVSGQVTSDRPKQELNLKTAAEPSSSALTTVVPWGSTKRGER